MQTDINEHTDAESSFLYADRGGYLNTIDPDLLTHFEECSPLLELAVHVICEGYCGIAIDEVKMSNGKYFQALNVNMATPEGRLFTELQKRSLLGESLPKCKKILRNLAAEYKKLGLEM
jgi:hypothetical protein